ncbi:MAG TPA: VOC family protein [bacterium]
MIKKVNHIGIAVKDVDQAVKFFQEKLGGELVTRVELPFMQQISAIVKIGDAQFELMQGTAPDSVVSKFIDKKGEGIHHLSLCVDDIDSACDDFEKKGMQIISRLPAMKMAFMHPKSLYGVLVELAQVE